MNINLNANIIDTRDIMAAVADLRAARDNHECPLVAWDVACSEEAGLLSALESILESLCGYGGDAEWEGDWYPATLIAESYFTEYAQELAEDCGYIMPGMQWPYRCIDWDEAADELKIDYSEVDIAGRPYFYHG